MSSSRAVRASSRLAATQSHVPTTEPQRQHTAPPEEAPRNAPRARRIRSHEPEQTIRESPRKTRAVRGVRGVRGGSASAGRGEQVARDLEQVDSVNDLPPVDEGVDLDEDEAVNVAAAGQPTAEADDQQDAEVAQFPLRSPANMSQMSGTTALTDLAHHEAAELDRDNMITFLPELDEASTRFLSLAVSTMSNTASVLQSLRDVKRDGSSLAKQFGVRERTLSALLETYGSLDFNFIRNEVALRALLVAHPIEFPTAAWRPDEVLYKANLACFANMILSHEADSTEMWDKLRALDGSFPLDFLASFSQNEQDPSALAVGSSQLLEDTFQLALDLRTHLALLWLTRHQHDDDFNPTHIIAEVFCDLDDDRDFTQTYYNSVLRDGPVRGWGIRGLGHEEQDLMPEFREDILERIQTVLGFVQKGAQARRTGTLIDLEGLSAKFSWVDLCVEVFGWIEQRLQEIKNQVHARGGVDKMMSGLKEASKPRRFDKGALSRLKGYQRRTSGSIGSTTFRQPRQLDAEGDEDGAARQLREEDHWRPEVDDYEDIPVEHELPPQEPTSTALSRKGTARQATLAALEQARKGDPQLMKENRPSFVDRQHDAERVEFDDGFDPTQRTIAGPSTAVHIDSSRSSGKKRGAATQTTEDVSEDDGFEEDKRAAIAAEAGQRRLQAQAQAGPSRPHARFSSPPEAPSPKRRSGPLEGPSPRKRQRTEGERQFSVSNRGSSEPEEPEVEEPVRSGWAANYRSTQNQAKAKVARTIIKRQTRVKWTEAEIEALIEYVEEHDTQWAEIKRIDGVNGVLADRDQVGLKDKARNMLMDWLKSGATRIPRNFEHVTLGAHYEKKLATLGIDAQHAIRRATHRTRT